jgi:hypothetical protein
LILLAQRFIIPDNTPLVYDPHNFPDTWQGKDEYNIYLDYRIKMGDPLARTQMQYKRAEIYFFSPLITKSTPSDFGYHLISFKLTIQGAVLSIDRDSFYRHGFMTNNDYEEIYQKGNLPYFSEVIQSLDNEEMENIRNWSAERKTNAIMLTSSASDLEELLNDIAERLIKFESK